MTLPPCGPFWSVAVCQSQSLGNLGGDPRYVGWAVMAPGPGDGHPAGAGSLQHRRSQLVVTEILCRPLEPAPPSALGPLQDVLATQDQRCQSDCDPGGYTQPALGLAHVVNQRGSDCIFSQTGPLYAAGDSEGVALVGSGLAEP